LPSCECASLSTRAHGTTTDLVPPTRSSLRSSDVGIMLADDTDESLTVRVGCCTGLMLSATTLPPHRTADVVVMVVTAVVATAVADAVAASANDADMSPVMALVVVLGAIIAVDVFALSLGLRLLYPNADADTNHEPSDCNTGTAAAVTDTLAAFGGSTAAAVSRCCCVSDDDLIDGSEVVVSDGSGEMVEVSDATRAFSVRAGKVANLVVSLRTTSLIGDGLLEAV
jgi:hypothetical protein